MTKTTPIFRGFRRITGFVIASLIATVAMLGTTIGPALAHAVLVDTVPAQGALLSAVPHEVTITFNETVLADDTAIVVIGQDGKAVNETPTAVGSTVAASLKGELSGWYAVSWHVTSADGHPISGAYTFRVGVGENVAPEGLIDQAKAGLTPETSARVGWMVSQWMSSLTIILMAGTLFILAIVGTSALRPLTVFALIVGLIAAFSSVLAAGFNGPQIALNVNLFDGPASSVYLIRAAAAGFGTVLLALGATRSFSRATSPNAGTNPTQESNHDDLADNPVENAKAGLIGLMALVLALVGTAVSIRSGHAAAKGGFAYVAVTVHLVFAACWLGAIPALALSIRHTDEPARLAFARFSKHATVLLFVVFAAGAMGTFSLSGGISSIAKTWGLLMVAKVSLVFVAAVIGAWNRWNVLPFWRSLHKPQILAPTILESMVLVLVVALSVSLLHNGPPSQVVINPGPINIVKQVDGLNLQLVIDPGRVGTNDLHLYVTNLEGKAVAVEDAVVTYSSSDLGIGTITPPLSDLGFGHYSGRVNDLGIPGKWEINATVRPDLFSQVELSETIQIR